MSAMRKEDNHRSGITITITRLVKADIIDGDCTVQVVGRCMLASCQLGKTILGRPGPCFACGGQAKRRGCWSSCLAATYCIILT